MDNEYKDSIDDQAQDQNSHEEIHRTLEDTSKAPNSIEDTDEILETLLNFLQSRKFGEQSDIIFQICENIIENPQKYEKRLQEYGVIENFPNASQIVDLSIADQCHIILLSSCIAEISPKYSEHFCELEYFDLCLNFLNLQSLNLVELSIRFISAVLLHCYIEFDVETFLETIYSILRIGKYTKQWCCRALYGLILHYDFSSFLKTIIDIAETIRNTADDTDTGLSDNWIAQLCTVLLKKNKNYLRILEWGQLLGGLVETLEQQYILDEFTPLEESFQLHFFRFFLEITKSTDPNHAARIIEMVKPEFMAKVIQNSAYEVTEIVLQILVFIYEEKSSVSIINCISTPHNLQEVVSSCFSATFHSRVAAVRLIHAALELNCSDGLVNMLISIGYFEKVVDIYQDVPSKKYILSTILIFMKIIGNQAIEYFLNSEISNDIENEDIDDDSDEYEIVVQLVEEISNIVNSYKNT
ncbi:hypothetical protein TVAG_412520 [Trichomonas vaginalis G3]|uniref:SPIN90/Ldb17 leucine-rich domain-containing protein n=1 Tax=Trichomonas vaginalis (strain ATCC PRA-98 / G3) TaxID=412133 RepID=A2EV65_TRIV3|nr:armadillo (ARM) repeat-containing protein family [Trichomonas vaginalis G3]EAY03448.1 hypothetical protein TVAG_412520 [Trichomonas vaginalis G3]KAI5486182.1 armadillo (ARM) repeat-containing protein family [Trichomonas vaginalis G3]|eukprot:XP_001315671.1 hypothetical protein [Trichomonas vaginalis G3]